jgi:putative addiction module CopG family antidote
MNVSITPDLEKFVQAKVKSGKYQSASEVFREALRLLAQHEERREKLDRDIQTGLEQASRGETISAEESKQRLAALRARLIELGHHDTPDDSARGRETWRITADAGILAGKPCIRGMRIRVADILEMLAHGASRADILADFPYLEDGDITAALDYAASAVDHRLIKAA